MTAFARLNWDEPDVCAIVVGRGIATVEPAFEATCEAWLSRRGYRLHVFDFARGISGVVSQIAQFFHWKEQFGYELDPASRNLDALRDGFQIEEPGLVLKLLHFDEALSADASWCRGFLSIISEQSLRRLALGERFFALLPVADSAALPGLCFERSCIPFPIRFRERAT